MSAPRPFCDLRRERLGAMTRTARVMRLETWRVSTLLVRVAFLLALFAAAQPAGAIQRWVFCNQNFWVDHNITNLIALMQRASAVGYTHMLLGDSKFSRLGVSALDSGDALIFALVTTGAHDTIPLVGRVPDRTG